MFETSRSEAESAWEGRTIGEFGPPSPPKSNNCDWLKVDRECQANCGPWDVDGSSVPETYCHGGEDVSKPEERSRRRRSLFVGAEV